MKSPPNLINFKPYPLPLNCVKEQFWGKNMVLNLNILTSACSRWKRQYKYFKHFISITFKQMEECTQFVSHTVSTHNMHILTYVHQYRTRLHDDKKD